MKRLIMAFWLTAYSCWAWTLGNCASADDGLSGGTGNIGVTMGTVGGSGHDVIIGAGYNGVCSSTPITISNGQGDTVIPIGASFITAGTNCGSLWYIKNATGNAAATYSMHPGISEAGRQISVCEISGMDATAPLDQGPAGNESVSTTNFVSGSITTTTANQVVFGYFHDPSFGSTIVAGTSSLCAIAPGCVIPTGGMDADHVGGLEYVPLTSTQTGTINFTRGAATTAEVGVASFKVAGGGGGAATAIPTVMPEML